MSIPIPANFDVRTQALDANEVFIRDTLGPDISNWAKFRHNINIGNNAANLHSSSVISDEVKEAYRELAKSHYEVVTSFGCARLAFDELNIPLHPLQFKKRSKDFYFHIGCLLDNLARIIFIINDPQCATLRNKRHDFVRHWIDWGSLKQYPGYQRYKRSVSLRGITNVRNNLAHSWAIPTRVDQSGSMNWPKRIRTHRSHPWPYDELNRLKAQYKAWIPVVTMLKEDLDFMSTLQGEIFRKLSDDVRKFEHSHNLIIS